MGIRRVGRNGLDLVNILEHSGGMEFKRYHCILPHGGHRKREKHGVTVLQIPHSSHQKKHIQMHSLFVLDFISSSHRTSRPPQIKKKVQ